ncbi:8194_t:CDS:1, partial [Cetraspora pellucida]
MKLARRQKKILLVSIISFFLVFVAIVSAVLLANKNQKKSSARIPEKNDSPSNNSNLLQTKAQKINFFKLALSADSIREEDLLTELKNSNYLTADKTDWKDYINEAATSEELQIREGNVKAAIDKLKESPGPSGPTPGPSGPTPGPSGPTPGPSGPTP